MSLTSKREARDGKVTSPSSCRSEPAMRRSAWVQNLDFPHPNLAPAPSSLWDPHSAAPPPSPPPTRKPPIKPEYDGCDFLLFAARGVCQSRLPFIVKDAHLRLESPQRDALGACSEKRRELITFLKKKGRQKEEKCHLL